MKKPSRRWSKKASLYLHFARESFGHLDLDESPQAALEMYVHESTGAPLASGGFFAERNAYAIGKRLVDLSITSWREDCRSCLTSYRELLADFEAAAKAPGPGQAAALIVLAWFRGIPLHNFWPTVR